MKINVRVDYIRPDDTEWKVVGAQYRPNELFVEVEVPDKEVIRKDNDCTVLTKAGLADVISQLLVISAGAKDKYLKEMNKEIN